MQRTICALKNKGEGSSDGETEPPSAAQLAAGVDTGLDQKPKLTAREYEIARLVAKGLPNKTIAAILEISPYTVQTHLKRAYCKFNVKTRAAMIARLMQLGVKVVLE